MKKNVVFITKLIKQLLFLLNILEVSILLYPNTKFVIWRVLTLQKQFNFWILFSKFEN